MRPAIHLARRFLVALFLLGLILPAAPVRAQDDAPPPVRDPIEEHHILVSLRADRAVAPNEVATLSFGATPQFNAPNLAIAWSLPDGGEWVTAGAAELGAVAAGQTVQLTRQVRFAAEGVHRVLVQASYSPDGALNLAEVGVLFFTVAAGDAAKVSQRDPTASNPMGSRMPMQVTQLGDSVQASQDNGVTQPNDPCFTVSGAVTRAERTPTPSGLNPPAANANPPRIPVRNALIEMREEDTISDDSYGSMLTDANGNYQFKFCDDDGWLDDELEIYVRLHAEVKNGGFTVARVHEQFDYSELDFDGGVYEFNSGVIDSEGGVYRIDFALDERQSSIFNIADAVYAAWNFWNASGGPYFDSTTDLYWEPGAGYSGSNYTNPWGNINIADGPADPDQWDDSVIIHEWGHRADDKWSCDDNGGGPHNIDTLTDDLELAWGEGYPDYFQSAVRASLGVANASFYLDNNAMGYANNPPAGSAGISVDLETYDSTRTTASMLNPGAWGAVTDGHSPLLSDLNELAIAAMLWDLNDANQDARRIPQTDAAGNILRDGAGNPIMINSAPWDRVSHGHAMIQDVYTNDKFESNGGIFDDTCTTNVYLLSWLQLNKPTDGPTAEVVTKNTGREFPFNFMWASGGGLASSAELAATTATRPASPDYRWWDRVTMVVDNSNSMSGVKLDAAKVALTEQLNDLAVNPKGAEFNLYTFDNVNYFNRRVFSSFFNKDDAQPAIASLSARADADPSCLVGALNALTQATQDQQGGLAWLYTDGDTYQSPSVAATRRLLNERRVRASIALLGGCGSPPNAPTSPAGPLRSYLGLAANNSQPGGIVPYLLTALGSGGQFLYVNPDQLEDAADILRAQISHSAGAGKWSDYVSDSATYRFDKLNSWEYRWLDLVQPDAEETFLMADYPTDRGQLTETPMNFGIPAGFTFYGSPVSSVAVNQDGYIELDPCTGPVITCFYASRWFLDNLRTDLPWDYIPVPPKAASAPEATSEYGFQVHVWTVPLFSGWYIISTEGTGWYNVGAPFPTPPDLGYRAYQIWLNQNTGEIRYLYNSLRNEAAGAEIGLRRTWRNIIGGGTQTDKFLVSNMDANGATPGMGYKLTPAPPQPSRTYTVTVDALTESVGFLQTGYSGNFEPMIVRTPDGAVVNCADTANVLCLTADNQPGDRMTQYIQVNVNGATGDWTATIDAGSSGMGTFSFNALAASALAPESDGDHLLASVGATQLRVRLPGNVDGSSLLAWLQQPSGARWGAPFTMFDDGQHGDDRAGDGLFGIDNFTPPGEGVGYLYLSGAVGGAPFVRTDLVPYNFQPVRLTALGDPVKVSNGNEFKLTFRLENVSAIGYCYYPDVDLPDGWSYDWDFDLIGPTCPPPNGFIDHVLTVYPDDAWKQVRSSSEARVGVTFTEDEEEGVSDSVAVTIKRYRAIARVEIDERSVVEPLRPGDTITITAIAVDNQGFPVRDGTVLQFTTAAVSAASTNVAAATVNGRATFAFTAPATAGDVTVTAASGGKSDSALIHVRAPLPQQITIKATPNDLEATGAQQATVVATLRDRYGKPVKQRKVRIVVEGDAQQGQVNGAEVVKGVTNAKGQVSATFTKVANSEGGTVAVRAELLVNTPQGEQAVLEARALIHLSGPVKPPDGTPLRSYLPFVVTSGQPVVQPPLVIYGDALPAGWENWSWDSTVDFNSAGHVKTGSKSIAVTFNKAWAGLSLRAPQAISTSGYAALRFWVYGGSGDNRLTVYVQAGDAGAPSAQTPVNAKAGQWTQVTIPLSALGNPSVVKRVTIQEDRGQPQATFYVDEITLIR